MARALVSAVTASALTAAAFLLNPSADQHRARIREAVVERCPIAGALGIGALAALGTSYHPLGIASYTTFNGRTVSVGAFGIVYVLPLSERG